MNNYPGWLVIATSNFALGSAFVHLLTGEVGDLQAFDHGVELYPDGTAFTVSGEIPNRVVTPSAPANAKFVSIRATADMLVYAADFNGTAPYTEFNSIGISDEEVDFFKAAIKVGFWAQPDITAEWQDFLETQGYEVSP